jgi:hypothetical protein
MALATLQALLLTASEILHLRTRGFDFNPQELLESELFSLPWFSSWAIYPVRKYDFNLDGRYIDVRSFQYSNGEAQPSNFSSSDIKDDPQLLKVTAIWLGHIEDISTVLVPDMANDGDILDNWIKDALQIRSQTGETGSVAKVLIAGMTFDAFEALKSYYSALDDLRLFLHTWDILQSHWTIEMPHQ